jgi:hypothetical protein
MSAVTSATTPTSHPDFAALIRATLAIIYVDLYEGLLPARLC